MSSYLDALNTLEGLQQNQNTPTPVGEWSPQEYFKEIVTVKLDKERILKDLKEGKKVPGCDMIKKPYVRGL